MRTLVLIVIGLTIAASPALALGVPELPQVRIAPDGITARTTFPTSPSDLTLAVTEDGNVEVAVAVFKENANRWEQVSLVATLRVFAYDAVNGDVDVVSKPFRSSATEDVLVVAPAGSIQPGQALDVFITFSNEPGPRPPTSHHNLAKNAALAEGEHDTADLLDYHHVVRPLAV